MNRIKKIVDILKFLRRKGLPWVIFRLSYEFQKAIGYFYLKDKYIILKTKKINYNQIEIKLFEIGCAQKNIDKTFIEKAENAIEGNIFAFSNHFLNYKVNNRINWFYNPSTKKSIEPNIPWHKIPDFGKVGDIKLIWEASRFPQIFFFINAHQLTNNDKYAYSCINQIVDWIEFNKYPFGPNYKCGQEISFRIFSWIIAICYFHKHIDDYSKTKILNNIYTSALRINSNINYAIKSVRNNHSISEASGLFIIGSIFSGFKESKKWQKKGLKIIASELEYQVNEDGSYIQQSMNYHRLVMDTLSFVILVSKQLNIEIPKVILDKHYLLIKFLHSFIQSNGNVPNYGSNDGAYLFPLNDYSDFRASLNFAHVLNKGKYLYFNNTQILDFFNYKSNFGDLALIKKRHNFLDGGYFLLESSNFFLFTRCPIRNTIPAHNDILHLDIWYKGQNIFCDSGTFLYNINKEIKKSFSGLFGHNVLIIDDFDYIRSVFNFGKTESIKGFLHSYDNQSFSGEHYGYMKSHGIIIQRNILLGDYGIIIRDKVIGVRKQITFKQQWITEFDIQIVGNKYQINGLIIESNYSGKITDTVISRFYNHKRSAKKLVFSGISQSDLIIETKILVTT